MQQHIDLILLDVQMPELDGFETAELISQRKKTNNIPIVFLTAAYKAEEFRQRGFELGAADYLTKPIDDFQLISRIRSYLRFIRQEKLHHRELEKKVAQRTAALVQTNQKLKLEIEERQRIQTELLQSKQQILDILTSITDAFFVVDAHWQLTYFNPQTCELLLLTEEALGKNIKELFPDFEKNQLFNKLAEAMHSQEVSESIQFCTNVKKWLQIRVYPYKKGLSVYIQDVSERKQVEDLQKELLEQTELANRIKSAFLANMSHELRTPLNVILGYTQILERDETLSAEHKNEIGIIQRSGWHLLTLIEDILDLAKLETKRIELQPDVFRLNKFLKDLVDLFTVRAHQKGLTFFYRPSTPLPSVVQGDQRRLRQIIVNLLGNAIKFTEEGGIYFRVKAQENKVAFSIEDTGIGINTEHLENLFVSFQKGENTTTNTIAGMGLGLVISQRLLAMMKSELHVQSQTGQGSTFWFEVELPVMQGISMRDGETRIKGYPGKPITLLIVDSSNKNRSLLTNLLKPLGFLIEEAQNGQEGLQKAQASSPAVVLTDLVLPVVDGFEFIRQLRKMFALEKSIIIAISESVTNNTFENDSSVGCDAFLKRPIIEKDLLALLAHHLGLEWIFEEE
jgi:PAS domain S-box-containing protein